MLTFPLLIRALFSLYLLQNVAIVLGVTWCNPDKITTLPRYPYNLPQSCVMFGSHLLKNDDYVGSCCPELRVSPGDDVTIKHTHKQIQYYINKQLHYTWEIEIPAPVWGCIELKYANKISVKGEIFTSLYFCDFELI